MGGRSIAASLSVRGRDAAKAARGSQPRRVAVIATTKQGRRVGSPNPQTRADLLDATERLMLREGYAAVSSRRVAAGAGVTPGLVHYYFPTLDDLFIAVFRRRTEGHLEKLASDLQTGRPLHVIWEYATDRTGTTLTSEFLALANHRKAIQAEIAETAERLRKVQLEALTGVLEKYGVDTEVFSPAAVVVLMSAIPRVIIMEEALGMSTGLPEARGLVESFLDKFEGPVHRHPDADSREVRSHP